MTRFTSAELARLKSVSEQYRYRRYAEECMEAHREQVRVKAERVHWLICDDD